MKSLYAPLFALLIIALASGCNSEAPVASSTLTGSLKGRVGFGSRDMADQPLPAVPATISVEGTNISTTSDSLGNWELTNLPAGTYTIATSRSGFATHKEIGFQFVGGGVAYLPVRTILWKQTTVTLTDLTAVVIDTTRNGRPGPYLHVTGKLNAPSTYQRPQGILFFGQYDSLSIRDQDGRVNYTGVTPSNETGDGSFENWVELSDLRGFTSGVTTRVLGYGYIPEGSYYDPAYGGMYSPNHTTPDTATFVMP